MGTYQKDRQQQQPNLRINTRLKQLLNPEVAVLDTSQIDAHMLQQSHLLPIIHPLSLHGSVRKKNQNSHPDHERHHAQNQKHDSPPSKGGVHRHLLESPRKETPQDLAHAKTQEPERDPWGLLGLGIPLTADQHEGGRHGGLEHAEEDSGHEDGLVVVGRGDGAGGYAPGDDVCAEPFCGGEALEEVDWVRLVSASVRRRCGKREDVTHCWESQKRPGRQR